jgi:hypothetical protein
MMSKEQLDERMRIFEAREAARQRIASMKTARGGWTKKDLETLGVPWPPIRGWQKRIVNEAGVLGKE